MMFRQAPSLQTRRKDYQVDNLNLRNRTNYSVLDLPIETVAKQKSQESCFSYRILDPSERESRLLPCPSFYDVKLKSILTTHYTLQASTHLILSIYDWDLLLPV